MYMYCCTTKFPCGYLNLLNTTFICILCYISLLERASLIFLLQVGSLCMTVVEHEIQRYQTLYEDMETKRKGG